MKNIEESNKEVGRLNAHQANYGIRATFMISPYPTSSVSVIPRKFQTRPKRFNRGNRKITGKGRYVAPQFEDKNRTTVIGSPGGSVTLSCNIFMLQDYTVSWVHRTPSKKDGREYILDLLTIGNSTYTSDDRISSSFRHPSDWGLKINNLIPSDAGVYLCQLSTFPARVRLVFLEIQGTCYWCLLCNGDTY